MTVCFIGHTSSGGANRDWLHAELIRVLYKLRALNQLPELAVAHDVGTALTATEVAVIRNVPVLWHPLVAPDDWPGYYANYDGALARMTAAAAHPLVDVAESDGSGTSRARRRRRSEFLADTYPTHLVVYDGRDRGSVLDHLQRVMGTHDLIVIDPRARSTVRIHQEAGQCLTPPSSRTLPSTGT